MSERLGVLGGTFDPPHVGHVRMAVAARDGLELDSVILAPATHPPHKALDELTAYEHRFAMAERAVSGLDRVGVSRVEEEGAGPSYTVDLLRRLRAAGHDDIYFIIGSDSLRDLPSWKEPERVLALCTLVVFPRAGADVRLDVPGDASVVVFEAPITDASSTEARLGARDDSLDETTVPAGVREYALKHKIYRRT